MGGRYGIFSGLFLLMSGEREIWRKRERIVCDVLGVPDEDSDWKEDRGEKIEL